jgi:orotidine-5'-phosphate decarboxylase
MGAKGWDIMERTVDYISIGHFVIADAKRGDIGNTSSQYATAFFDNMGFDAITVAPYMGEDSVKPFLDFLNKWTIILALTSNAGSKDFQQLKLNGEDKALYEKVLEESLKWGSIENTMYVVGATKADELAHIRKIIPQHFLLVPGVGFQGGSLAEVSKAGMNDDIGLLVNVSRAVIYASEEEDFAQEARAIALQYQQEMAGYIR